MPLISFNLDKTDKKPSISTNHQYNFKDWLSSFYRSFFRIL